jgi:hypothetical protein
VEIHSQGVIVGRFKKEGFLESSKSSMFHWGLWTWGWSFQES